MAGGGEQPGGDTRVEIRFALPSARLRRYFTTYYATQVTLAEGVPAVEDHLYPEWPNVRFVAPGNTEAAIVLAPLEPVPSFAVTGPTSRALRFRIRASRSWGIGLLPLGWASLFGAEAARFGDRFVDGRRYAEFAVLAPLAQTLAGARHGLDEGLAIIEQFVEQLELAEPDDAEAIEALTAALVDSEIATVAELAGRCALSVRSLERLSRRVFGFPPKLLLRRARFLRSLAQFMLDPTLKWLGAIDYHYHDQAHFVRDFKRFMGMTPSAYAKRPHPILGAAVFARAKIAGTAVQGLHDPKTE